MNRLKFLSLSLALIFGIAIIAPPTIAKAATETEIEDSIAAGVAWLASQQNPDGSWGSSSYDGPAYTGFVLIKLQDRAYELGYESPFDPGYAYSANVAAGWGYVFSYAYKQTLSIQNHGGSLDDPDANGNGYGIYFSKIGAHPTYATGVVLMALEASGTPNRLNDGGHDFDGVGGIDTFLELAQDGAEWLAWAQGDSGNGEGGWAYSYINNGASTTDNSNGGYATLGLAAAEGFGCTIPAWAKTELSIWIDALQDPVNGDADDGGSWYQAYSWAWVNQLKTGNLIFEMTFAGDDQSIARFQNAMDYIEKHWHDVGYSSIYDPSWGYGMAHAHYQAMFCLMKGFEYSEIEFIDHDMDGTADYDWYAEFAQVLVDQQYSAGYWYEPGSWGTSILDTVWALLTLERVIPNHPPVADAGPDQTVEQTTHAGAEVTLDGSGSYDPDDDPITYLWTYGSWSSDLVNPTLILPLGTHTITLTVSDGTLTAADTVDITVVDTTPPVIEVSEEQLILWPPNHKYHTITIADFVIAVTDNCDSSVGIDDIEITQVTSDEPEDINGNGDGKTVDDIVIVDSQTVKLRAERQGKGDGRVYTIHFAVTDHSGNTAIGWVTVWVPHDQGDPVAVDSGVHYTVWP